MLKALFLDLDETLCDTRGANSKALAIMTQKIQQLLPQLDPHALAQRYIQGIYRELDARYQNLLLPINDEGTFRIALLNLILQDMGIDKPTQNYASILQQTFDNARTAHFNFFPGIKELLIKLRMQLCLIVITNGPEFSQVLKVNTVQLNRYVDHIIIGGQEKEQKPAASIFQKALNLAHCTALQSMHIGDSLTSDIAGANNCGIPSVWISHGQKLDTSLNIKPTYTLNHPSDLNTFLTQYLETHL